MLKYDNEIISKHGGIITMILIFIIFFASSVVPFVHLSKSGKDDYMSVDACNAVKGFFLFFVFVRHFLQYEPVLADNIFETITISLDGRLGQLIVVMFLFYSGYGVFESAKTKGNDYIKSIPRRRIWKTWTSFAMAVCVYIIVTVVMRKNAFSFVRIALALVGWESYGNSNWYIFTILVLYGISYFALRLFGRNSKSLAAIFILSICYALVMYKLKPSWWYNTVLCYFIGCFWSQYKQRIDDCLRKHGVILGISSLVIFILLYTYCQLGFPISSLVYIGCSGAFALVIVQISRYIYVDSKILVWGGVNLFPLYIYQRLPMIIFQEVLSFNGYLYFAICISVTLCICILYIRIKNGWKLKKK